MEPDAPLPRSEDGQTFPRSHRLSGRKAFAAVYAGKFRQGRKALLIFAIANSTGHGRLGLSVSRKVGTAPQRATIKRRLRDAFRKTPTLRNAPVDWLIVVRPHVAMLLSEYQAMLSTLRSPAEDCTERDGQMCKP